ncbi:hypothetical protein DL766_005990 [Monosporascus sp. MC13-8B]|uniref:Xylanolytic transcriptional activator regulatory domain-containing protein n=1 Tax=Monosporascus cannonballus TaxID=155416 RepID=A0ABY0HBS4_9PEZI|nr:hypothetical protein DL762_004483 [Monosporascus cannonballus]RYO94689.1 hypothetical protein DL763_003963 [Monosporascus cannonballus]RYP28245.1 hypothetical protein DL766_005990 [Monosporascus sp. MC13-8B]
MEAAAPEVDSGGAPLLGAQRAIRCDKSSPCSNCRISKRACSSTGAGQKPKEPRQRVLISSQYERKIDQIEERLGAIERLLQNLVISPSGPGAAPAAVTETRRFASTLSTENHTPPGRHGGDEDDGYETPSSGLCPEEDTENFEGNSSLAAHTAFASEFLQNAVEQTSILGQGRSPKIDDALSALRRIVDMQQSGKTTLPQESRWLSRKSSGRVNLRDLSMPPMSLAVSKLKEMKHGPAVPMQTVVYAFADIERFVDRCRRVYFATEEPSEGTFIIVNAGLAALYFEASVNATDPAEKAQYKACRAMCAKNLEVVLAQLNLMVPSSIENIEALLMSASFALELSRPSLAWALSSRAVHMCRSLGLHQAASTKDDSPEEQMQKRLMFWCTYMLDKGLSLRMGRASVLQDYDISQPPVIERAYAPYPAPEVLNMWVAHARSQGRLYERLYSPAALQQDVRARVEQVNALAAEFNRQLAETHDILARLEEQLSTLQQQRRNEIQLYIWILKSDEVSYLSSLTLAYRALPPMGQRSRTFADECIDAARAAMLSHQETMDMNGDKALKVGHLHWTIIYAPFIPFIVIFCLVIETSDAEDLQRLADFVKSLEVAKDVSASVGKLHHLCQVLYNVALLYVEAKGQQPADQDMVPVGNEFDMYLSQLGFMPTDQAMTNADLGADDQTRSMAQTTQLGDWFSGNNYMLGLVEEDLSAINSFGFPL